MHGPQAAALKVGVDDVLLLRLGVGDTGLKDATAATIFAFELGVAAGVVAIFDDVGGLAAGAVVGDGGLDHGGHQRDQGQSILMYHVGLRYYRLFFRHPVYHLCIKNNRPRAFCSVMVTAMTDDNGRVFRYTACRPVLQAVAFFFFFLILPWRCSRPDAMCV